MMQSAQDRHGEDTPTDLGWARYRCILAQGQVCARLIVVGRVTAQQMAQMPLAEDNDMIKAVPPDRADQPFAVAVLPWRSRLGRPIADAHRAKTPEEHGTVNAVPVAKNVAWPILPSAGLGDLTGQPFGCWMRGDTQP